MVSPDLPEILDKIDLDFGSARNRAKERKMGNQRNSFGVYGYVSRHNSLNDKLDDVQWDHLVDELRAVWARPEYESLDLSVMTDGGSGNVD